MLRIVRHHDLLAARPDGEARMIPAGTADVEEEVVGIDEEVRAASAMQVIEGGDRGSDQGARAHCAARPADHEAEAVLFAEALEEVDEPDLAVADRDLKRRAAQLSR
jgi:hypothetical protein